MIGKLVEWQTNRDFELLSKREIDAELEKISGVRLMKLLYFICLRSVKDDTVSLDKTLFGIFNRYLAMPKGPVEDDVYSNRGILLRFDFKNRTLELSTQYRSHFGFNYPDIKEEDYNNCSGNKTQILQDQIEKAGGSLTHYKDLIDNSIEELKKYSEDKFPFTNTEKLVDMVHLLPLWNKYFNQEDKEYQLNIDELKEEGGLFREKLA